MSAHHITPSSRGGEETCEVPDNFHEAWHICFENLTPEEIIKFVKKLNDMMRSRDEVTWADISMLRDSIKEG